MPTNSTKFAVLAGIVKDVAKFVVGVSTPLKRSAMSGNEPPISDTIVLSP
jgi:hypothetical protein